MRKYKLQNGLVIAALFGVAAMVQSCGSSQVKTADDKQGVIIPDSLLNTLNIDSAKMAPLVNAVTLTGQVDFNQDHVVNIFPLISGNIEGINVVLGDYVQQGQVLGTIRSAEMAGYSNDLNTAETNLNLAEKNLAKTKDMYKSGLASATDSISAEIAYKQAQSELERVKRVLSVNGGSTTGDFIIKAPIS